MATAPISRAVVNLIADSCTQFSVTVNDLENCLGHTVEKNKQFNEITLERALFIQRAIDEAIARYPKSGKLGEK